MSICVSYNSHLGFAGSLLPPPLLAEILHPSCSEVQVSLKIRVDFYSEAWSVTCYFSCLILFINCYFEFIHLDVFVLVMPGPVSVAVSHAVGVHGCGCVSLARAACGE